MALRAQPVMGGTSLQSGRIAFKKPLWTKDFRLAHGLYHPLFL